MPPPPGLKLTPLLDELATKNRTFTLKYKDKAYMEVQGKLISLGRYVANKSSDLWHVSGSGGEGAGVRERAWSASVQRREGRRCSAN